MEGFEIGRRRPLLKRDDAPNHILPPPSDENSVDELSNLFTPKNKDKKGVNKRSGPTKPSPESNPHKVLPLIEVDLHIYELVDSTVGMDNYTMLQFQLDTVRKTMRKHYRRIGQKIVFIHGKGDGVLRKEVRKLLAKEYASCDVQDASFLKYGFGATEVTVRQP